MTAPVLDIDFGSQVTQLIARRVHEGGVYCDIVPFNKAEEALGTAKPKAIILSGGPASVIHPEKGGALGSRLRGDDSKWLARPHFWTRRRGAIR